MSSSVERGGKFIRPCFNYQEHNGATPTEACTAQMTESIRNVLEDIQRSQVLQCDVAHAIKDIAKTLRRIDRRLAKKIDLRGD